MKMLEKTGFVITENIEMDLISSESRMMTSTQMPLRCVPLNDRREHPPEQVDPEPDRPKQSRHPTRSKIETDPDPPEYTEEVEIEMEVFPPLRVADRELMDVQSDHSSIISEKCHRVHWRRRSLQARRLTVKDVVCLPAVYDQERPERLSIPHWTERAAMGLMARVTIDSSWSADQVESRLTTVFTGESRHITVLQCVPGSRVLFVPQTPADGWTGEQVLRISALSVLYIVCHYDNQQVMAPS